MMGKMVMMIMILITIMVSMAKMMMIGMTVTPQIRATEMMRTPHCQ